MNLHLSVISLHTLSNLVYMSLCVQLELCVLLALPKAIGARPWVGIDFISVSGRNLSHSLLTYFCIGCL